MGVAIIIDDVNWTASAVAQVTLKDSGGGSGGSTPAEVKAMYTAYMDKTGRTDNPSLLKMMSELYKAGLLQKCTGLFYLASASNNLEHIKYSITDLRGLSVLGVPTISSKGIKGGSNIRLTDSAGYNMSAKGFCSVFMVSEAATAAGMDWGGDLVGSAVYCLATFGNASYMNNTILRWHGSASTVTVGNTEDTTGKDGVYVIYAKGTSLLYKHNTISLTKTITASTVTSGNPVLLNYTSSINNPTIATHKMYATFNNDLSTDEVAQIQTIFEKYKDLI